MSTSRHVVEVIDLLEKPGISGSDVLEFFNKHNLLNSIDIRVERISSERGYTDFVKIIIPGSGGNSLILGIIGRLGAITTSESIGLVSDADGAIVALASAYKIADLRRRGYVLPSDVIVSTHICPRGLVIPHKPAPLITSPVDLYELVKREVDEKMTAILSIDATKANLVIKQKGFAITPTVMNGWILRVSSDLIDIYMRVTGKLPLIVPITMQDILPYTTNVYHINSMLQPWIFSKAPVVGVAITSDTVIPGSATGVTDIYVLEQATRFVVEVAKEYTNGKVRFYDEKEWEIIVKTHGDLKKIMCRGLDICV